MKKIALLLAAAFALFICAAYSLEVNREEISSETSTVDFINYTGPHSTINTIEEIRSIGSMLGLEIRPLPPDRPARVGNDRYRVIHAVDPSSTNGFDADILVLGSAAAVDHIDNLRRIISAYLSSAYGYPARDADTLAFFVTVYNAVHRGDLAFFQGRYKNVVTRELSADSAGLARSYADWAGRTQIVIPLSDPMFSGTLSTVDTSSLVERDVIESIKTDESAPRGARTAMTELIERESDEAESRAEQARREAAQARREASRLQRATEEAQRAAETARQVAEEAAALAIARPSDREAARTAREAATAAEERQREAEALAAQRDAARAAARESASEAEERQREAAALREQQEEAERRAAAAESRAAREQELAGSRQELAAQERREIAADMQEELDREAARRQAAIAAANSAAILRVTSRETLVSEILLVDAESGSVIRSSPLNSVRNRTLIDTGNAYMAVAGQGSAARLVLIDKLMLDVTKESAEAIASESMLVSYGNAYYAVVSRNGAFYIGRFDSNLNLQATSSVQVQPYTAITVSEGRIIVQDSASRIRILRATDLIDLNG